MELSEDQEIRLEICEKCYEHHQYDQHLENQFQDNFLAFTRLAADIGLKILRNQPPKYLTKAPNTKFSTKRHVDSNTGKIVEFPDKGCFEVYYKNILIYSKLQTSAFPDLPYLCLILKTLKSLYLANPIILGAFEKFRDIQYQWKKNQKLCESLYTYVIMNACGNKSQECVKSIINGFVDSNMKASRMEKKKTVYPYLIYDNKQKKHKIQSIYCPKTATSSYFTHRASNSLTVNQKFISKQKKQIRPQTGQKEKSIQFRTANHAWTQRQIGTIVKNTKKNEIFELVIKEENKTFNEQKFKLWMKQQNLSLEQSQKIRKVGSKHNSKQKVAGKENKPALWSLSKDKKRNNSKEVYVAYLNNLKEKKKVGNNKFQINFKKNKQQGSTPNKNANSKKLPKKSTNQMQIQKQSAGNLSSSRFGSIRKNLTNRQQLQQENPNQQKIQNGEKGQEFSCQKKGSEQKRDSLSRVASNQQNQNQQSQLQKDEELEESCLIQPTTNKSPSKISKNSKQSRYSKVKNSIIEEANSRAQTQNEKSINKLGLANESNLKIQSQVQIDQNQHESRQKRVSIEEATVQKRIISRKRSSHHQRYSQGVSRLQLTKELISSPFINQNLGVDTVLDEVRTTREDQWEQLKQNYQPIREPAQIIKKFVQEQNFFADPYSSKYSQLIMSPNHQEVEFTISGQQLTNKFQLISIRKICRPSQLRLFPQIFKQIEYSPSSQTPTSSIQTFNISLTLTSHHKSKLMHVVNLMLRSNPMMISRIFEDKKYVNPYGVYCVWLRSCNGRFQPVFVNDFFVFQGEVGDGKLKPVYSWLSNQNSIWYMILEKAVAKVLGGYHMINQLSLAQLMSIIMSSPTVDIGYINPQKAIKVFDEKIFYNKMASIYTLRQNSSFNSESKQEGRRVDRIIGFSYNKRDPKESAVTIKIEDSSITVSMREFMMTYGEISLLFFNNNYFLNQSRMTIQTNRHSVLSCHLTSNHSKNTCYLMFSCFPQNCPTKVTLYRQLSDEEAEIKQGMNPLSQEDKRYEYIGEIYKTGNFFFQVQVNGGEYICLMENGYQLEPFLSIFSEFPIRIGEIKCSEIVARQKEKMKNSKIKSSKNKSRISNVSKNDVECQTPKILIEHRIPLNKFKDEKRPKRHKQPQNIQPRPRIKLSKQYAYQPDNLYEIDEQDQQQNKQNNFKDPKKHKSKQKDPAKSKTYLNQIRQKQQNVDYGNIKKSVVQIQISNENGDDGNEGVGGEGLVKSGNMNRIIDNYD